jgi:hypothetical protein
MAQRQTRGSKNAKRLSAETARNPPRVTGKDVLHVIIIGLVCTVLFSGIGILISTSKGVSIGTGGSEAPLIVENGTVVPTLAPVPTDTEIPCEAQAWWDGMSATTASVFNNVLSLTVEVPPAQIKAGHDTFNTWKASLDSATGLPDCVANAQQALSTAAAETEALYGLYLSASNQIQRAQEVLRVMDTYLVVTNALDELKVTVNEDWFSRVRDFSRADCPARRWYIQQFIIRDYQRYFTMLDNINITRMSAGELQSSLIDLRTLTGSITTDTPSFPDCVKTAIGHYTASIDAATHALNDALNGNLKSVSDLLITAVNERNAFQNELLKLDPVGLDPKTLDI